MKRLKARVPLLAILLLAITLCPAHAVPSWSNGLTLRLTLNHMGTKKEEHITVKALRLEGPWARRADSRAAGRRFHSEAQGKRSPPQPFSIPASRTLDNRCGFPLVDCWISPLAYWHEPSSTNRFDDAIDSSECQHVNSFCSRGSLLRESSGR
jgi:hypothetical protein